MSYSGGKSRAAEGIVPSILFGIGDLLYMIAVTVMFSILVYYMNNADFRWFMAVGAALGCAGYHMSIGRLVMLVSGTVTNAIRVAVKYAVVIPVVFVAKLVWKCISFIGRNTVGRAVRAAADGVRSVKTEIIRKQFKKDILFSDS